MCLSGAAKCGLLHNQKKPRKIVNNLRNNTRLNSTRLENRKLVSSESAEKYIADISGLALLVGIKEGELSKSLIRGLPPKLHWHVVSFNPTSLCDTIQQKC